MPPRKSPPDRITVEGIEFTGPHGWTEDERRKGASFRVDVTLRLDLAPAGQSDEIADTVDWRRIASTVTRVGTGRSFRLVERLGEVIAREVLSLCPEGTEVEVSVAKTSADLPGTARPVVVLRRRRAVPWR